MNKYLSLTLTAALLAASAMPALADNALSNLHPYVGADYQHMRFDYNDNYDIGGGLALDGNTILDKGLNGGNIHVGIRPHKNFGAEIGYFRTQDGERGIASGSTVGPGTVATGDFTTKVRTQGFTLDALGYVPVDQDGKVELIGTGGVLWNKAKMEINVPGVGTASDDESEIDWRIGGGFQVNMTEQLNLRGLVRYQSADFEDTTDHVWVYTAGVNFNF